MKKKERIREVIEYLISSEELSKKFNRYHKVDIENAILICREALDQRTVEKWYNLLWKLQYIIQPECGIYALNIPKLEELEVKLPVEADPKQRRLLP